MATTTVVISALPDRFHGFLSSCMCEVSCGVFVSANMNRRVRDHVWEVLNSWFFHDPTGSIVMVWKHRKSPGGIRVRTLGVPKRTLTEYEGMLLVKNS